MKVMVILMVKDGESDDDTILIIYDKEPKRKEVELVDFGVLERNMMLFEDPLAKNCHWKKETTNFGEFQLSESVCSFDGLFQLTMRIE